MLELPFILALLEELALPAILFFLSSEAVGLSKSKHSGVLSMVYGIAKAVVKELSEECPQPQVKDAQSPSEVVSSAVTASKRVEKVIAPTKRKTPQRGPKGRFQKVKDSDA